ncbi:MAG: glycosyltransferase [Bacteroidia bacterium]|nr:glycosyltransferase [Bacteroidia bacterium]
MVNLPSGSNKIIFAPLNWGLGHATRSIPLINYLLSQNKEVIIASDGEALGLLREEFPQLHAVLLPGYNVKYKGSSLFSIVFRNSLKVLLAIIQEHLLLKKLIVKHNPNVVISDSRFGFWNKKVYSVIISHQLKIPSKSKLLSSFVNTINAYLINRFSTCWIPDYENGKLSGDLSKNKKIRSKEYIGVLSRLKKEEVLPKNKVTIILSGPEPARTKLEEKLISTFSKDQFKITLVRGTNNLSERTFPQHWNVFNRLNASKLNTIINSSEIIISRSGYTSVMDYYLLNKKAILIPTPGQSEQEYLGAFLNGKFGFVTLNESDLSKLKKLIN